MNTRKGFTLVELLVVIAILAILATVGVVGYTSFIDKANLSAAETELHQVETSVDANIMARYDTVLFSIPVTEDAKYENRMTKVVVKADGKAYITTTTCVNTAADGETPVYKATSTEKVVGDEEAFVITLNGDFEGLLTDGTLQVTQTGLSYEYATGKTVTVTFGRE